MGPSFFSFNHYMVTSVKSIKITTLDRIILHILFVITKVILNFVEL